MTNEDKALLTMQQLTDLCDRDSELQELVAQKYKGYAEKLGIEKGNFALHVAGVEIGCETTTYKTEFSRDEWAAQYEVEKLEEMGAIDQSFHNDACPSWTLGEASIAINTDEACNRYCVFEYESPDNVYYHGNDFKKALVTLETHGAKKRNSNIHPTAELKAAINKVLADNADRFSRFCEIKEAEENGAVKWGEVKSFIWHSAVFEGLEWEIWLEIEADTMQACQSTIQQLVNVLHQCDPEIEGHVVNNFEFKQSRHAKNLDGKIKGDVFLSVLTTREGK